MAIENQDWWYIGGAAAGGALVGIIGSKLFGEVSEPESVFTGFIREYEWGDGRALVGIWALPGGKGYSPRMMAGENLPENLASRVDDWLEPQMMWQFPEQAAEEADSVFVSYAWFPVDKWGFRDLKPYPFSKTTIELLRRIRRERGRSPNA